MGPGTLIGLHSEGELKIETRSIGSGYKEKSAIVQSGANLPAGGPAVIPMLQPLDEPASVRPPALLATPPGVLVLKFQKSHGVSLGYLNQLIQS